jgi:hypothetical protein
MTETPVVQCVLLWARPGMEAQLSAFEDKVLRLVGEHGGGHHDGEPPTEVQSLRCHPRRALTST